MATYAALVEVDEYELQNVQELASLWGDIQGDLENFDASIEHSYAVLGEYDFLVVFDAPDRDTAFKISLTMGGYGLDVQTMEITPTEHFGRLVDDESTSS